MVRAIGEALPAARASLTRGDVLRRGVRLDGDDVGHRLALLGALVLPSRAEAKRHLDVRLVGGVRIILRALRQLLGDDELVHGDGAGDEVLAALAEGLVDVLHHVLRRTAGEDGVEDVVTLLLGERGPIATDDVETLLLHRGDHAAAAVRRPLHLERGVLLLLEQEHRLVHPVNLNLQELIALVHLLLHRVTNRHHLLQVVGVGVDHDGIGITVNDVHTEVALREIDGGLQNLATLQGGELGEGLGVKPRSREPEATVHRVRRQLERQLADIQLLAHRGVTLRLDHVLHLATALDELANHLREHRGVGSARSARGGLGQLRRRRGRRRIARIRLRTRHGGEADIVLLDDGRIQRVEIQHKDVLVVQTLLGFEDEAAGVGGSALLLAGFDAALVPALAKIDVVAAAAAAKLALLGGELVREEVLAGVELVEQEVLDAPRAGVLQGLGPEVARDVGQLAGERQHREVEEQPHGQPRVVLRRLGQAQQVRRGAELARNVRRRHLVTRHLQLVLCQRGEGVRNLLDEIARREVGVRQQATRHARQRPNARAASVVLPAPAEVREPRALQATDFRPVRHLVRLQAVQEDVEVETGDVVPDDDVRVQLAQTREEDAEQTALGRLAGEHRRLGASRHGVFGVLLLHHLVPSRGHGHAVESSHDGEVSDVFNRVEHRRRRRLIDANPAHVHQRRGRNLVHVLAVVHHRLEVERGDGQRGRLAVGPVVSRRANRLVPVGRRHLERTPRSLLRVRNPNRAADGDPGRTHHPRLDQQVFEHGRLRAEHAHEVVPAHVRGQRRVRRRVAHLEHVLRPAGNIFALEAVRTLHGLERELFDAARQQHLANLRLEIRRAALEASKERPLGFFRGGGERFVFRRLGGGSGGDGGGVLEVGNLILGILKHLRLGHHEHASLHVLHHRARAHGFARGVLRVHGHAAEEEHRARRGDVLVRVEKEKRKGVVLVQREGIVRDGRGGGVLGDGDVGVGVRRG